MGSVGITDKLGQTTVLCPCLKGTRRAKIRFKYFQVSIFRILWNLSSIFVSKFEKLCQILPVISVSRTTENKGFVFIFLEWIITHMASVVVCFEQVRHWKGRIFYFHSNLIACNRFLNMWKQLVIVLTCIIIFWTKEMRNLK